MENFQRSNKLRDLNNANEAFKKTHVELTKKFNDKERYNKILIDKIKILTEEKNKILTEENEKRNKIIKDTENFVKDIQSKYQDELPDRQKLIDENQLLRQELDESIKYTMSIKQLIESQKEIKETKAKELENEYKNMMGPKIEGLTSQAQKYLVENSELKTQIIQYQNKCESLQDTFAGCNKEYEKLMNEIEKVKLTNKIFRKNMR